jgi:hypothetical protein
VVVVLVIEEEGARDREGDGDAQQSRKGVPSLSPIGFVVYVFVQMRTEC